ncbi:hypothetical protein GALMADRAFT_1048798 [Galerina marginata CBS 339.88]|uniref:HECT-type E3 ubiquitin transferase n=1 Tax=Galerina marginata (strain CBS 339.88) TaxID=685588 RepID=A0A067SKG9_GALM3|nr:hypothetical protein GALMADRAFT_1048798 [Galerina marginata CBS 339.88]
MSHYYSASWYAQYHEKNRLQKAVKIQTWWRRMLVFRAAKKSLRKILEGDITGLTGLRCLVLIGVDNDVLGIWTRAMVQLGPEAILAQALGKDSASWLVLMRKVAFLLCQSLAHAPESSDASSYLDILMLLLSNERAVTVSGSQGSAFCQAITAYLMKKRFLGLLRESILKLVLYTHFPHAIPFLIIFHLQPIESSKSLPSFLDLCMLPLSTYPKNSPQFARIYVENFFRILSIPLLPEQLPIDNPPPFISYFLLTNLDKLMDQISRNEYSLSNKVAMDLAANLFTFLSPHYERLSTAAFASYLQISVTLINRFNIYARYPASPSGSSNQAESERNPVNHDTNSRSGHTDYEDPQWIQKIATAQHITNLLNYTQSQAILLPDLAAYLFVVTAKRPSSRVEIRNIVLANSSGRLVGDLYREIVRHLPLGQEESSKNIYKSVTSTHWRSIILLADLYSLALETMDDDEFFGEAPGSHGRNPLTLEEVAAFSVQLLNIVFSLYWWYSERRSDSDDSEENEISDHVSLGVYCSWTAVREKLLRCLSGIHTRDCRQPFLILGHWLIGSQLGMNSFIEAAIIQEQRSSVTCSSQTPRRITDDQWNSMRLRLSILKHIPFAIPFETRVSIFQHLIANNRVLHRSTERLNAFGHDQRQKVKIRRDAVARDGYDRFFSVDRNAPLEVVMVDQFGQEE